MTRMLRMQRIMLRWLCVILVAVCAFCLLLPHSHHGGESIQCPLCDRISRQEQFVPMTVTVSALCFAGLLFFSCNWQETERKGDSPVLLKVKLSD